MLFFGWSPWHKLYRSHANHLNHCLFCVVLVGALYPHIQSVGECPSPMIPSQHQHVGTGVAAANCSSLMLIWQIGKLGFHLIMHRCEMLDPVSMTVKDLRHANGEQK